MEEDMERKEVYGAGRTADVPAVLDVKGQYNIFTDASTMNKGNVIVTGAQYIIIKDRMPVDSGFALGTSLGSTGGELYAICLGLEGALRHGTKAAQYNLFSDSLSCINILRRGPGNIIGWDEKPIREMTGQSRLIEACLYRRVFTLLKEGLHVDFYHQPGHCSSQSGTGIFQCIQTFQRHNNGTKIDFATAEMLCYYNDFADRRARIHLTAAMKNRHFFDPAWQQPLTSWMAAAG